MEWIFGLAGVALGGILTGIFTWMTDWRRSKRDWHARLKELKIQNYAEWAAAWEANLDSYATQSGKRQSRYDAPLCEKRLLLIEDDPEARRLIGEVRKSIPDYGSPEFEELQIDAHNDPAWDWTPFSQAMGSLLEYVRKKLQ